MRARIALVVMTLIAGAAAYACGWGSGDGADVSHSGPDTASGERIAFYREGSSGEAGIWTVPARGGRASEVMPVAPPGGDVSWSPDGTLLAYAAGGEIHVVGADGEEDQVLTHADLADPELDWSPDGSLIAFTRDEDVWVTSPDGETLENLTATPAQDEGSPTWSPDASEIAFTRDGDIWIMAADGSGARNTTSTPNLLERYPDWSPDGTTFVFQGGRPGTSAGALYTMRVTGASRAQLTEPGDGYVRAEWSPDGTALTFTRVGPSIGYMKPDGSGVVELLADGPAVEAAAVWEPA